MEEQAPYIVKGKPKNSEVMLAVQRLSQFCKQFDKMTEEEKQACIERVNQRTPRLLMELFNVLNEYIK